MKKNMILLTALALMSNGVTAEDMMVTNNDANLAGANWGLSSPNLPSKRSEPAITAKRVAPEKITPSSTRQSTASAAPLSLMQAVIDCNSAWAEFYKDGRNKTKREQVYAHFSETLKANHAQVNTQCECDGVTMTPLMMAAHFGLVIIVADLLAVGASVTATDSNGHNAAWYAEHSCLSNNPQSCPAVLDYLHHAELPKAKPAAATNTQKHSNGITPAFNFNF